MAILGNKKNKIPVKQSDLKQAIVKKNNALKASNDNLKGRIKSLEKESRQVEKDLDNLKNDYRKY